MSVVLPDSERVNFIVFPLKGSSYVSVAVACGVFVGAIVPFPESLDISFDMANMPAISMIAMVAKVSSFLVFIGEV